MKTAILALALCIAATPALAQNSAYERQRLQTQQQSRAYANMQAERLRQSRAAAAERDADFVAQKRAQTVRQDAVERQSADNIRRINNEKQQQRLLRQHRQENPTSFDDE